MWEEWGRGRERWGRKEGRKGGRREEGRDSERMKLNWAEQAVHWSLLMKCSRRCDAEPHGRPCEGHPKGVRVHCRHQAYSHMVGQGQETHPVNESQGH